MQMTVNELKITIKTDGISDEEKATKKFQSAYKEMLAALTSSSASLNDS